MILSTALQIATEKVADKSSCFMNKCAVEQKADEYPKPVNYSSVVLQKSDSWCFEDVCKSAS